MNRNSMSVYVLNYFLWVIFSIYRTPNVENLTDFFEKMTISLTKVTHHEYENITVTGDFNIDIKFQTNKQVQTISVTFVIFFI